MIRHAEINQRDGMTFLNFPQEERAPPSGRLPMIRVAGKVRLVVGKKFKAVGMTPHERDHARDTVEGSFIFWQYTLRRHHGKVS